MNAAMTPLTVSHFTLTTCLGNGRLANLNALQQSRSGLVPGKHFALQDLDTWVGMVADLDQVALPVALRDYHCRNNQLAWLALQQDGFLEAVKQAARRHGTERIGVFIGTSTSGIRETEKAYQQAGNGPLPDQYQYRSTHNVFSIADLTRRALGLHGPAAAISTACSSSAKVFASAWRAIQSGLCDAAVVGGVDSLCHTTLYGFNALQLVSSEPCRPYDLNRNGISIGEAGGFALLEPSGEGPQLLGYGESSDAYHMSSPHPQGDGALLAMRQALQRAQLEPDALDYVNLHGTGTRANDAAEAQALTRLLAQLPGTPVAASSTKGFTGHTLGAAGIVEACFCLLAMEQGLIPPNLNLTQPDPTLPLTVTPEPVARPVRYTLSNSFGFGGSNCSLVFGGAS